MTRIKTAKALIIFSFIYWIIYNSVFGWNIHPENELEKTFDLIYTFIWKIAFVIYLLPLLDLYEKKVKKHGRKN